MVCQHSSCLRQGAARVLLAFQVEDLPDNMEATHSLKDILEAQKHYTFSNSRLWRVLKLFPILGIKSRENNS